MRSQLRAGRRRCRDRSFRIVKQFCQWPNASMEYRPQIRLAGIRGQGIMFVRGPSSQSFSSTSSTALEGACLLAKHQAKAWQKNLAVGHGRDGSWLCGNSRFPMMQQKGDDTPSSHLTRQEIMQLIFIVLSKLSSKQVHVVRHTTPHATFDSSGARTTHSEQSDGEKLTDRCSLQLKLPNQGPNGSVSRTSVVSAVLPGLWLTSLANNIMKIHPTPGASPRRHISKLPCRFSLSQPVVFASSHCSRFPSRICRS